MGLCKKDTTPMLTHWSYGLPAPSHRYHIQVSGAFKQVSIWLALWGMWQNEFGCSYLWLWLLNVQSMCHWLHLVVLTAATRMLIELYGPWYHPENIQGEDMKWDLNLFLTSLTMTLHNNLVLTGFKSVFDLCSHFKLASLGLNGPIWHWYLTRSLVD